MSAKVDSAALQDGYQLYHHTFVFDREGRWAVVQQGMNTGTRWARRYHWLGEAVEDFVCEPHQAVCCDHRANVLNMIARESEGCRNLSARLSCEAPEKIAGEFDRIRRLVLPHGHAVSLADIRTENLRKILEKTYERRPEGFESLLGTEGVGPKTIRALALVSELVHGKAPSFDDPVRFSFAHGGKDGHPYPVDRKTYDVSIGILKDAVNLSKVGRGEKLQALKRLNMRYG